jgi:hypothetical protein
MVTLLTEAVGRRIPAIRPLESRVMLATPLVGSVMEVTVPDTENDKDGQDPVNPEQESTVGPQ